MTSGNDYAYPIYANDGSFYLGLTKREYFAAVIAQGMFANPALSERAYESGQDVGIDEAAVHFADRLIEALNKEAK